MREISKFLNIVFFLLFAFTAQLESKILSIGSADAKVTVKVFSSLTCPHCASFHDEIFNNLKKDFIDKGLVRFEHHAFPLDLAALNAGQLGTRLLEGVHLVTHELRVRREIQRNS